MLSMWIGTRLGIIAAWRRGRPKDTLIGQVSLAFYSMPDFWLGMVFIGFFAGSLAWLPGGLKATPGGGGGLRPHPGRRDAHDPADRHARAR